ncbi:MAG TPA: FAD-binding oxidoreductase [Stackebrandtia sp.]|uniref:FAD-binding oxidoreductase n=1 Tax=Stackebrandtia sp. TaxID=2023065 RepID=UPI002D6E6316|nr:FAD-binding oxidoreductase [Stackebrandtia sp.]HZE40818.1 FAD-binding oxidoreductase [Stackebrandtia sp.]
MNELRRLGAVLDGDLITPAHPAYDTARKGAFARFDDIRPAAVAPCASAADVARVLAFARHTATPVAPRGGGHCFAGRSSTGGVVIDTSRLDAITVDGDGTARVGAGARLGRVYRQLHRRGRTIPAGCGPGVGIAGLTLGGGLGLLGRSHGLTCDALRGARVVLADGRVVDCDADNEPDLWWGLRGAGGGQFGVVTRLTFATVAEPRATRFALTWPTGSAVDVAAAWQDWAPEAPDDITANLTIVAEPARPPRATVFGSALRGVDEAEEALGELVARTGTEPESTYDTHVWSDLKRALAGPEPGERPRTWSRSEFFTDPLPPAVLDDLIDAQTGTAASRRELNFTAMGGSYRRLAADATAFAHRHQRFLLEHVADDADAWPHRSWARAHAHGTGAVYANFPDPHLDNPAVAYHGANLPRLVDVKRRYDPDRLLAFPQSI